MHHIRQLELTDYYHGILSLLAQLTTVGEVTFDQYKNHYDEIGKNVYVMINSDSNIIATATLLIEKKFIHSCGKVGHIEDVVVDHNYRGKGIGNNMIEYLTEKAIEEGCYKVILDCSESNVGFYEKCGFERKGVEMALYVKN
jgi:glucosamine-phosphate N-acetyltransferase